MLLETILFGLSYDSFSPSKAPQDDLHCVRAKGIKIAAIVHLWYPEIKGKIRGSAVAGLMNFKGILMLFNKLQGQIAEFWQVCIMLRIIEQGGWVARRDRRLYDSLHITQLNAIKTNDLHGLNVASEWISKKEICLVYGYQLQSAPDWQRIRVEWLYYIPFYENKTFPDIKSGCYFGISPNHFQLLHNNAQLFMKNALKAHLNSQQTDASSANLNSN